MVIDLGEIQRCEHLGSCHRLKMLFDVVHWVSVVDDVLGDHVEVDADLESPFGLGHVSYWRQVWANAFFDWDGLLHLSHFLSDGGGGWGAHQKI